MMRGAYCLSSCERDQAGENTNWHFGYITKLLLGPDGVQTLFRLSAEQFERQCDCKRCMDVAFKLRRKRLEVLYRVGQSESELPHKHRDEIYLKMAALVIISNI